MLVLSDIEIEQVIEFSLGRVIESDRGAALDVQIRINKANGSSSNWIPFNKLL